MASEFNEAEFLKMFGEHTELDDIAQDFQQLTVRQDENDNENEEVNQLNANRQSTDGDSWVDHCINYTFDNIGKIFTNTWVRRGTASVGAVAGFVISCEGFGNWMYNGYSTKELVEGIGVMAVSLFTFNTAAREDLKDKIIQDLHNQNDNLIQYNDELREKYEED